jgi:hypothetical protein
MLSYLKWKTYQSHSSFHLYFHSQPIYISDCSLSIGIKAMSTQKDCIEKLESEVHEVHESMQKLERSLKVSLE